MPTPPTFPVPTLAVRAWADAVIDEVGHDVRSAYVERFWLNILGPSSTWLLRRLVNGLDAAPDGFELDLSASAVRARPRPPLRPQLAVRPVDRAVLPLRCRRPPGAGHAPGAPQAPAAHPRPGRAPARRAAHRAPGLGRAAGRAARPVALEQMRQRARQMALSLLELGEDGAATERQLHRWRIHPAVAHEATGWAVARHREAQAAQARQLRAAGGSTARSTPPEPHGSGPRSGPLGPGPGQNSWGAGQSAVRVR